jgi:magnesium chelatase family protein
MDRIDIHLEVPSVKWSDLQNESSGESSEVIRRRVQEARDRQLFRYKGKGYFCNAHIPPKDLEKYCAVDDSGIEMLRTAIERFGLSARAYDRIIKVSRTIADLAGLDNISAEHISEAIQYRTLDRKLWLK